MFVSLYSKTLLNYWYIIPFIFISKISNYNLYVYYKTNLFESSFTPLSRFSQCQWKMNKDNSKLYSTLYLIRRPNIYLFKSPHATHRNYIFIYKFSFKKLKPPLECLRLIKYLASISSGHRLIELFQGVCLQTRLGGKRRPTLVRDWESSLLRGVGLLLKYLPSAHKTKA